MANKKCPICKKIFPGLKELGNHIERKHTDSLPKDWSGIKYNFYLNHGRVTGKCHVCKGETKFNEATGRPEFLCTNPKCKDVFVKNFENNMIKKYGKARLLDDPEYQEKKMLANRSIAKKYKWSDGSYKTCIASFEYDIAQFLDIFMNFSSNDVMFPAPMIIEYEYEGNKHFYIPDVYIGSLNLIIEVKDGGDNPNTHGKIQSVDKVKEKLKEEAIKKDGKYNYVKVENKQYGILLETLMELKNREFVGNEDSKFVPVFMTEEIRNLREATILNECEIYKDNHIDFGKNDNEHLIINNNILAEQVTEYEADNNINEYTELLNKKEMNIKEKFILRSLNTASNINDLIISESYITKIVDKDKKELFDKILENKKVKLVYHNNTSNDIISLQEADNLVNKIKDREFRIDDYNKEKIEIISESIDFLLKIRPTDLDYTELVEARNQIHSLT